MSMLTSSRIAALALFGAAACLWGTHIRALEGADGAAADKAPTKLYQTPRAALKAGLEDFQSGDSRSAIEALKYAAAGGEPRAQWKLAKIYASGDGVPRDDVKAYDYFSQIVVNYDEDSPNRRDLPIVASAFVAVGVYSLNGISDARVRPDPARAMQMFQYAATNFGDANAQYNLARMHLDGAGVGKDSRQALPWLRLAAEKGHVQAEAMLGQILFAGMDGIPPQRARALMWLTLAREAAIDSKKDQWIIDLYDRAMGAASDEDRQLALTYLEDHLKRQY
ncbi:tetratricopeptide repeat protein [Methylocapsa polymorpha]|uniref:Tetratricopeptide repeat protein n=1 Tax=Methylocapsa polymorpha TaxID=3080828 RepID=A0ABZ0HN10_9HYPH|nr:tetratricopeptide repeat protein [Methylocapsa sp. RX1]